MHYKLSDFKEHNSDVHEVKSSLNSIKNQIETLRNHFCCLPFESEPAEFLKVLSDWQSKKKSPEDNYGR